jgi:hypothetical protein
MSRRRGKTEAEILAALEFIDEDDDDLPPLEADQLEEEDEEDDDREETEEVVYHDVLVQIEVCFFFFSVTCPLTCVRMVPALDPRQEVNYNVDQVPANVFYDVDSLDIRRRTSFAFPL